MRRVRTQGGQITREQIVNPPNSLRFLADLAAQVRASLACLISVPQVFGQALPGAGHHLEYDPCLQLHLGPLGLEDPRLWLYSK